MPFGGLEEAHDGPGMLLGWSWGRKLRHGLPASEQIHGEARMPDIRYRDSRFPHSYGCLQCDSHIFQYSNASDVRSVLGCPAERSRDAWAPCPWPLHSAPSAIPAQTTSQQGPAPMVFASKMMCNSLVLTGGTERFGGHCLGLPYCEPNALPRAGEGPGSSGWFRGEALPRAVSDRLNQALDLKRHANR